MKRVLYVVAVLFGLGAFVAALYSIGIFLDSSELRPDKPDEATPASFYGTKGDYVGGMAGTALSFATVLLVFAGIFVQQIQLSEEREARARAEKAQKHDGAVDRFEKTFFELLSLQHRLAESLSHGYDAKRAEGRICFWMIFLSISADYGRAKKGEIPWDKFETLIIGELEFHLAHYFGHLFYILSFIHRHDIDAKKEYIKMLNSQLMPYERILLLYYVRNYTQDARQKELIERYGLLVSVSKDQLLDPSDYEYFSGTAYLPY